jgi:hypothetical protein
MFENRYIIIFVLAVIMIILYYFSDRINQMAFGMDTCYKKLIQKTLEFDQKFIDIENDLKKIYSNNRSLKQDHTGGLNHNQFKSETIYSITTQNVNQHNQQNQHNQHNQQNQVDKIDQQKLMDQEDERESYFEEIQNPNPNSNPNSIPNHPELKKSNATTLSEIDDSFVDENMMKEMSEIIRSQTLVSDAISDISDISDISNIDNKINKVNKITKTVKTKKPSKKSKKDLKVMERSALIKLATQLKNDKQLIFPKKAQKMSKDDYVEFILYNQ